VEVRASPALPRTALEVDRDLDIIDVTGRRFQPGKDALAQRWSVGEYRLETSTRITRGREERHCDGVEREHPPAAAARLDFLLGRLDNRVDDFERIARPRPHESSNRAIEGAGELRFEVPGFSQKIHVRQFLISPAAAAALTMSPAAGAAVRPPYPRAR
jgi:hypothetical protein